MSTQRVDDGWRQRAKRRMQQMGMDVSELARLAGYATHTQTSQHLSGSRAVPSKTLVDYARALECPAAWLARGEGAEPALPGKSGLQSARTLQKAADATTLGQRCRFARTDAGFMQAELARRLSTGGKVIGRQAINKIELDQVEDPQSWVMCRYEEVTGFNARWLVMGRGEPKGKTLSRPDWDLDALGSALVELRRAEQVAEIATMTPRGKASLLVGFYETRTGTG
jgi:transcriptional regulator with XRE-family HTH domain